MNGCWSEGSIGNTWANSLRSGKEAASSGKLIQKASSMGISPRVICRSNPESQTE